MYFNATDKMSDAERKAIQFQTAEEANAALKAVKDEADFRVFQTRLAATDYYRYTDLKGRRNGCTAYSFSALPWNANKADYLYDNGRSTGRTEWSNLHKYLVVEFGTNLS
jgi:hypothetical protein